MSEPISRVMQEAVDNRDVDALINVIPYARLIGIECASVDDLVFKLPKKADNIGNPSLPAIHGGVLGGFLETAGILHVLLATGSCHIPKVVDFSLDFLSPGRHEDTFARCELVRQGRKVANVTITARQGEEQKLIATARAHLLLVSPAT